MKLYEVISVIIFTSLIYSDYTNAETFIVGPNQSYRNLKPLVARLKPGDEVLIEPGKYREALKLSVSGTREKPIVIRGIGKERPVFDAKNLSVSGRGVNPRAILQVEGAYLIIEHLEFKNARNGNNGAGIRLNSSTNAIIRDCKISYCDMGIQGGDQETVLIENCEISHNGSINHNGYSHNLYMLGNRVVVRNCYIHDSLYGQNFKSRAHYNELWYNWIVDSNEGEVGPVDGKGDTDRPNSNTLMVGNVIVSKPDRTGNRAKYILMGSESGGSHDGTLYLYFNILIAGDSRVKFVQLDDPKTSADIRYNVFWGSEQILINHKGTKIVTGQYNWIPTGAKIPMGFQNSYVGTDPGFENRKKSDYRLTLDSPLHDVTPVEIEYIDGDGQRKTLVIDSKKLQIVRHFQNSLVGVEEYLFMQHYPKVRFLKFLHSFFLVVSLDTRPDRLIELDDWLKIPIMELTMIHPN